jgi:hypothetical protein
MRGPQVASPGWLTRQAKHVAPISLASQAIPLPRQSVSNVLISLVVQAPATFLGAT